MKLLYSGEEFCDQPVMKRMLVVAAEIHFMDRPSVTFKNWGTVGSDSYARRIDWSGSPVLIDVFKPPVELYRKLIHSLGIIAFNIKPLYS